MSYEKTYFCSICDAISITVHSDWEAYERYGWTLNPAPVCLECQHNHVCNACTNSFICDKPHIKGEEIFFCLACIEAMEADEAYFYATLAERN